MSTSRDFGSLKLHSILVDFPKRYSVLRLRGDKFWLTGFGVDRLEGRYL